MHTSDLLSWVKMPDIENVPDIFLVKAWLRSENFKKTREYREDFGEN